MPRRDKLNQLHPPLTIKFIVTICDYLDIWCLTIKHPDTAETEQTKGKDKFKIK